MRPPNVTAAARAGGDRKALRKSVTGTATPEVCPEAPEHRGERRAFLIWACMIGAVPPSRVVERIVAELEREASS